MKRYDTADKRKSTADPLSNVIDVMHSSVEHVRSTTNTQPEGAFASQPNPTFRANSELSSSSVANVNVT